MTFEEIICQFFEYIDVPIIRTKKTRDFGIDGIIKLKLEILGEIDLGLQIKNTVIDSNDVDMFITCLRNAELQLGVIICQETTSLQKYDLNSKIKAILLAKGIKMRENIINESLSLNPLFILKMDDIIEIVSSKMRNLISLIYKK